MLAHAALRHLSLECVHTMPRLLIALLLMFMPLQFIWAAASPYCQHEVSAAVTHFGHHAHEHHAEAGGEDLKAQSTTTDMDCHACHGVGTGMALNASSQAIVVSTGRPVPQVVPARVHPPLSRPERPNWTVLA